MKKSLLTIHLFYFLFYCSTVSADTDNYCLADVPKFEGELVNGNTEDLPIYATADYLEAIYPTKGIYEGNVVVKQGNRTLQAKRVEMEQFDFDDPILTKRIITAVGDVLYQDDQFQLNTPKIRANIDNSDVDIEENNYAFVDRLGRGKANSAQMRDKRYSIMKHASFTVCPVGDNSWSIEGSTIKHDTKEGVAEIWNAVFKVGSIPIFYSPYLQFPTDDRRRSGLLMPTVSYNKTDGLHYSQPYYWNIAPNFDATITTNLISRRGIQWQNEFRYLSELFGNGTLAFDWMPNDRLYKRSSLRSRNDGNRWLFYLRHQSIFDQSVRFNVDYTKVSDGQYFSDLDSLYGSQTDGYATQKIGLSYVDDNWDATLSTQSFQIFDNQVKSSYKTAPKFDLFYYQDNYSPYFFKSHLQFARFDPVLDREPIAMRFHVEPTLNYMYSGKWWSINSEAALMFTHYWQDIPESYTRRPLKSRVTRVLPSFSIDGKVILEREMSLFDNYTQTLEPRIKYRYVPYRDQSGIGNYDSVLLQPDYFGLFRNRLYSGLDRIASANQISAGLTTRMYDEFLVERFNASIGQIYYFEDSRTGDLNSPIDKNSDTGSLVWSFDSYWKFDNSIVLRSGIQYDTRLDAIALSDTILEYRRNSDQMVQLSYRYANKEYISALDLNINTPYKQDISQLGIMTSWPLTQNLSAVASYYYDVGLQQSADSFIGFQYNSCCWGASIVYGRKITGWNLNRKTLYDNKVSFNFELRGLTSPVSRVNKLLNSGILPYQQAF